MRSEEEIRRHIRALLVLKVRPCDCHVYGPAHTARCVAGGQMMEVAIQNLRWALGDTSKDEFVAKLNSAADEFTRGG